MFASILVRSLFTVGLTLLPIILANLAFHDAVPAYLNEAKRAEWLQQHAPTRYGVLLVTGCLSLAIMLSVVA